MTAKLEGVLFWCSAKCNESKIVRRLHEILFWIFRVDPADPRFRDGLDWFYLFMVLVSNVYMGLLAASLFFEEIPQELVRVLTSPDAWGCYIALAIIYTIAKEIQKRNSNVIKRRGGQIIVYQWLGLALGLIAYTLLKDSVPYSVFEPALDTLRIIAVLSTAHLIGARYARSRMNNHNGNGNGNGNHNVISASKRDGTS